MLGAGIVLVTLIGLAALFARHVWRSKTTIDFRDPIDDEKVGWG